jgi:hypothetical protein
MKTESKGYYILLAALRECITSGDATCYNGTNATRLANMQIRLRAINAIARVAIEQAKRETVG